MAVSMNKVELLEIPLEDILTATNNFNHNNFIGGGGFGKVYKGALPQFKEHNMVAIKRLDRIHGQGDAEYLKEITMLSRYTHENLISLLGFCKQDREMILVYKHASRGSLDRHLHSADLTWKQRLKICLGAAKGINYLHDPRETSQRLIHCDIKSANILLDDEWNAKVSDFGLSKIAPATPENSTLITGALGTPGYCDPLFFETCELTKESDVYSFGVVLFEVLCGKVCTRTRNGKLQILVFMWKKSYEEKKLDEIMCPNLRQNMDWNSLEIFSDIAFQCLKRTREERPRMSLVVEKLETALRCLRLKPPKEFEEIVNAAVPPLIFESIEELKVLLSKGFFVNDGKTRFSINDKKEHILLISIKECLINSFNSLLRQYSHEYNLSFKVGTCNIRGYSFKTRVKPQYLSPCITYTVSLIFKCPQISEDNSSKQQHISLTYTLVNEEEKRRSIVYFGDKKEDEWLRARLHQFTTTSDPSSINVDLEFNFEGHEYELQIEGIEFQQLKVNAEELKADTDENTYQEILKNAKPRLMYASLKELNLDLFLSKGLLINRGTWLSINDNKEQIVLRSIGDCLIFNSWEDQSNRYSLQYNSRFEVGTYSTHGKYFGTRVSAQYLLPCTTYVVNLIFKCSQYFKKKSWKPQHMPLKFTFVNFFRLLKLDEKRRSIVYIEDKSEDEWLRARLHQFTTTSEPSSKIEDLEFHFQDREYMLQIEGIEFQQLKVNADELKADIDENKHYEILSYVKPRLVYTSLKEDNLDLGLSEGQFINGNNTWFHRTDKGQHCEFISFNQYLIPRSIDVYFCHRYKSRFRVGSALYSYRDIYFKERVRAQFLTPFIAYNVYLVFKFVKGYMELQPKEAYVSVKYNPRQRISSINYAYKRKLDDWWMVKLCELHNKHGETTADLEITFYANGDDSSIAVDGIEFLPTEEVEKEGDQVLDNEKVDDDTQMQQPIPSS